MHAAATTAAASAAAFLAVAPVSALHAHDSLLLQQSLTPDTPGLADLALDRDRVLLVRVRKGKGSAHTVEVTLDANPPIVLSLHCIDQAAARQLLDALLSGSPGTLNVSGRCRL